ncbi:MAG: thermonuclease family protein [Alphaproteobacteria bacterium]|nr:thermonuclease family protein [Alphaproteobacteria bacterium]
MQLDDGRLFGLVGLEIPDFNPYNPGPITQTAIRVLNDLLVGMDVNIYQQGKKKDAGLKNRMGHHLAHLEKRENGAWVQGVLLSLGLARVKTERRNTEMTDQMLALEAKARSQKIGLWALPEYQILMPAETAGKDGQFAIVEGKVISTAMKQNRVYINFGDNWKDDFTITIAPEYRTNFFKTKLDPLQLNGKTIRVRGWVTEYNGPVIEIDHPERIEVLKN